MVSAPESTRFTEVLRGVRVVDCDTHYTEPPDLWTSRAPAKFKERVPHVRYVPFRAEMNQGQSIPLDVFGAEEGKSIAMWFVEGDQPFGPLGTTVVDHEGGKVYGKLSLATYEELDTAAYEPQARLKLMDRLGIWAQIMYPNAAGFSSNKMMSIADPELRYQCLKIYNDAIADFQAASGNRVFGQALLPVWDRELTVKEAQRCVEELKLTGFTVADKPETMGLPPYDAPHWEPFWEFVNAARVPVNFHIGGSSGFDAFQMPWSSFGPQRKLAIAATLFYMSNAATIANFVLSGLFDKYPNLKLVSVESGIGWIPFVIEALEYQLDEMIPDECKHLQRRPKEYFRDHIYACFWFEDYGPRAMIDIIGAGNVLFETDFPHPTCLYPKAQEHIADVLQGLDRETRKKVLQDNAAQLYRLPIPAA
jgi:predicted TIM-barrel fold metal-dependent hydrolase